MSHNVKLGGLVEEPRQLHEMMLKTLSERILLAVQASTPIQPSLQDSGTQTSDVDDKPDCKIAYQPCDVQTQTSDKEMQTTEELGNSKKTLETRYKSLQEQLAKVTRNLKRSETQLSAERRRVARFEGEQKLAIQAATAECRRKYEAETKSLKHQFKILKATNEEQYEQLERFRTEKKNTKFALEQVRARLAKSQDALASSNSEVLILKERIAKLERNRDMLKPLVAVGVAIRVRFMAQAREFLMPTSKPEVDQTLIRNGNIAAHRGNIDADGALLLSGIFLEGSEIALLFKQLYVIDPIYVPKLDEIAKRARNCEITVFSLRKARHLVDTERFRVKFYDLIDKIYACVNSETGEFQEQRELCYEWLAETEERTEELVRMERGFF